MKYFTIFVSLGNPSLISTINVSFGSCFAASCDISVVDHQCSWSTSSGTISSFSSSKAVFGGYTKLFLVTQFVKVICGFWLKWVILYESTPCGLSCHSFSICALIIVIKPIIIQIVENDLEGCICYFRRWETFNLF